MYNSTQVAKPWINWWFSSFVEFLLPFFYFFLINEIFLYGTRLHDVRIIPSKMFSLDTQWIDYHSPIIGFEDSGLSIILYPNPEVDVIIKEGALHPQTRVTKKGVFITVLDPLN